MARRYIVHFRTPIQIEANSFNEAAKKAEEASHIIAVEEATAEDQAA